MVRKLEKKQHSRRKRIQLDEEKSRKSPTKEHAAPSSSGGDESARPQNSETSHHIATRSQTASRTEDDIPETEKQLSTGSPARSGGASPEPNCAICLGKLENKSFTDSCFHQFCYVCLLEWSKVKAECPLCKQTFKSIIHNVRSYDDYDQYYIPRPEDRDPLADFIAPDGRRFRYRTTVTDHRYFRNQSLEDLGRELQARVEQASLQRPSRRYFPSSNHEAWRRLKQAASSSFRRGIYMNGLKVKEPVSTRRRFRETAPAFFRENAACMHRLVPWLNRELNAVLEGRENHVAYVLDLIMGLIKRYSIDSEEFYQHVYPFIGRFTRHFMHEFLMFAKSPYHMAAYDQHATYEPSSEYVNNESDNETLHHSDGNESDVMIVSPTGSAQTGTTLSDQIPRPAVANAPTRIQPTDTNLLPWESSIISMAQPNYSYFNPVLPSTPVFSTRHSRTATSSQPSASGWDSPIPGPSWNIGGSDSYDDDTHDIDVVSMTNPVSQSSAPATITSSSLLDTIQPLDLSSTTTFNLSDPGTASTSEDSNIYRNFLESLNLAQTSSGSSQAPAPESSVEPTSKLNPVICSDSDSDSDAVMIVDYEKPWLERSPIHLSTDNSSDCDILITGTSNMAPDKRAKRKMKTGEVMSDMITLPSESVILEKQGKKRKHRSRSKSSPRQYRKSKSSLSTEEEKSRTQSPLLLHLNIPQYKDKFSKHYRREKEKSKHKSDRKHHDSHRSTSHSSSRSKKHRKRSISSSSSDGEHVSFRSHKHKSRSGMEIMEYFKKRVKRKKSKKKSKHRSPSPDDFSHLFRHKSDKSKERQRENKRKHKHSHDRTPEKSFVGSYLGQKTSKSNEACLKIDQVRASFESFLQRNSGSSKSLSKKGAVPVQDCENFRDLHKDLTLENHTNSLKSRTDSAINSLIVEKDKDCQSMSQKEDDNNTIKPPEDTNILGVSNNIEFVEMLPSQASLFDKELESVTQLLSNFTEPIDTLDHTKATFKKHPHGHKRSSKTNAGLDNIQACVVNSSSERDKNIAKEVSGLVTLEENIPVVDNHIQLNAVTSCTDPETDEPSLHIPLKNSEVTKSLPVSNTSHDVYSPGFVCKSPQSDGEQIDVDGQSGSDVDILKIDETDLPSVLPISTNKNVALSFNRFDTTQAHDISDSVNLNSEADLNGDVTDLDVEGLSDSESNAEKCASVTLVTNQSENTEKLDTNQSENTEKEIDVTGVSDSETIPYLSETNDVDDDSGSEIDVLAIPTEDIIVEAETSLSLRNEQNVSEKSSRISKTLCLESDSEGIDLDYQYENGEEMDSLVIKNKYSAFNIGKVNIDSDKYITPDQEDIRNENKVVSPVVEESALDLFTSLKNNDNDSSSNNSTDNITEENDSESVSEVGKSLDTDSNNFDSEGTNSKDKTEDTDV